MHCLNVHPSLLPQYRGAAPIQWQIVNGEPEVGVTVQELSAKGFDLGRILAQQTVALSPGSTYAKAEDLLANHSGELLVATLRQFEDSKLQARSQTSSTTPKKAPKIKRTDIVVRWTEWCSDTVLARHLGLGHHYPLTTSLPSQEPFHIRPPDHTSHPNPHPAPSHPTTTRLTTLPPGATTFDKPSKLLFVRCANDLNGNPTFFGVQWVKTAAAGGKGWVTASSWWNGKAKGSKTLLFS